MKKLVLILGIVAFLTSCSSKKAETKTEKQEERHEEAPSSMVSLTELQIKTTGIELDTIAHKSLDNAIKSNGSLTVPNQNKAFVTSVNSGIIKTLLIQPGSYLTRGQAVATIANPGAASLQQELQTINARISLAEIEYQRQKELVDGNAAPLKNVQRVQTELTTLKVTRNSLQKQLSSMGISVASVTGGDIITTMTVRAPISGTVSNVTAQIGSNVDPSTPIAEIVNNSQLHLDLFVFEKDLQKLRANQTIHFTLTNNPGKEYDALIYSVGTAFANESKTIPVHAVVKGDKTGLIEGMNISAIISIGRAVVPAVPTEAIVTYQGRDYIFVLSDKVPEHHEDDKDMKQENGKDHQETRSLSFEKVQVIRGTSDVGFTEVKFIKNLSPKIQIVTKGAFFVLAKMTNAGEGEHGH